MVALCYLGSPFNSNRDYNVLFWEQSGKESPAQIKAFGDTWKWAGAAEAWADLPALCPVPKVIELMRGFHNMLGENDVMAYLVMMAPRLYHLWHVLKSAAACTRTQTVGHYLRLILEGIFGAPSAGFHKAKSGVGKQVPAMQTQTVGDLLDRRHFEFPVTVGSDVSFKSAAQVAAAGQAGLDL